MLNNLVFGLGRGVVIWMGMVIFFEIVGCEGSSGLYFIFSLWFEEVILFVVYYVELW